MRYLRFVPDGDNPHGIRFHPVEEGMSHDNHFTEAQLRELRNHAAGVGEIAEMGQRLIDAIAKLPRRNRPISANVGECGQELRAAGWRESDAPSHDSPSSASASAMTSARS